MTRPNDALHELAVKAAHEWNAGVPAQEIDINAMVAYVLAATPPRSDARAVELLRDVRDHLWPSQSEEWTAEARHLVDRIDAILALRDSLPQSVVNDTPASEDIVTLRERVESAEYRAAEYQRINGLHNTELDSPREQLATAKAGLRVLQSESAASKNEEKSDG